jgi:hypothetical protein
MLRELRDKISDRKLRLFACACARSVWGMLSENKGRLVVRVLELHTDRLASLEEIPEELRTDWELTYLGTAPRAPERCIIESLIWRPIEAAHVISLAGANEAEEEGDFKDFFSVFFNLEKQQADFLRDICGNPFQPPPTPPKQIALLAQKIYAGERELMPLLGEWLQEHGYWSEGEHCLDPKNQHVKGCWVVDWVTGRE